MATDDIDCGECADTGILEIFYEMDDEGRCIYLTTTCPCRDHDNHRTVSTRPYATPDEALVPTEDFADVPF